VREPSRPIAALIAHAQGAGASLRASFVIFVKQSRRTLLLPSSTPPAWCPPYSHCKPHDRPPP